MLHQLPLWWLPFMFHSMRQTVTLSTYLPSASLALAYCRWILGEETCGSSSPTFALSGMKTKHVSREEAAGLGVKRVLMFVSPVLATDVNRCSLVIVLAFFIELSSFRELLEERNENHRGRYEQCDISRPSANYLKHLMEAVTNLHYRKLPEHIIKEGRPTLPSCSPVWLHIPSSVLGWGAESPERLLSWCPPSWWTSWLRLLDRPRHAPETAQQGKDGGRCGQWRQTELLSLYKKTTKEDWMDWCLI